MKGILNTQRIEIEKNWENIKHLFKEIKVAAHTTLLHEGDVSRKMYFVKQGCLRLWYNHNGKDITFQFFFEKQPVSSIESFWTGKPSLMSIESIEPSTLLVLTKKNFEIILLENPALKDKLFEIMMGRLENYALHFLSFIKDNPKERYMELLREKPHIIQRVPQHYIASYLGITPVSLSRIRNKIQIN